MNYSLTGYSNHFYGYTDCRRPQGRRLPELDSNASLLMGSKSALCMEPVGFPLEAFFHFDLTSRGRLLSSDPCQAGRRQARRQHFARRRRWCCQEEAERRQGRQSGGATAAAKLLLLNSQGHEAAGEAPVSHRTAPPG